MSAFCRIVAFISSTDDDTNAFLRFFVKDIEGLSALPVREIKEIMDALIERELFRAPAAKVIYRDASKTVKSKKLHSQVAEEAVRWARSKK